MDTYYKIRNETSNNSAHATDSRAETRQARLEIISK